MGQAEPGDFVADYARLGAPVGCDFEDLKRCYRRAVRELHPDLNPDLADDQNAQGQLRELLSAFHRLNDYHRHFGRLPGAPRVPPRAAPVTAAAAQPRDRSRTRIVLLLLAGAGILLLLASEPAQQPGSAAAPAVDASPPLASGNERFAVSAQPKAAGAVRMGDKKRRVRRILGAPIVAGATTWDYGPSHVRFKDGRVVDWYSSPLKPIAVDEDSRKPDSAASPR